MPTYKRQFVSIAPISGALSGSIGAVAEQLDDLVKKPLAIPQSERLSAPLSGNFYQIMADLPVFVGLPGTPAELIVSLQDEVIGGSGSPIIVTNITSDLGGLNPVVGDGYVTNPVVWFSENIPSVVITLRYGVKSSLGGLPETVLLMEPRKIAEVQADTNAWIAQIKGTDYDQPISADQTLLGLDERLDQLESSGIQNSGQEKEFGIAPEFSNMVFDNSGLSNSNGTWLGGFETEGSMLHTYLDWSTNITVPQTNRMRIMIKMPGDFGAWNGVAPIKVWLKGIGSMSDIGLNITLSDTNGAQTNINNSPIAMAAMNTWEQVALPTINVGAFTPNEWVCLTLTVLARDVGNTIRVGRIDFAYLTA